MRNLDPAVGRTVVEPPDWRYEHLDFNQAGLGQGRGHPALRDLAVRRAIAQSIDKQALWEAVFPGAVRPSEDPCTNATPTNYWQLPNAQCLPFDVNAANARLDGAGYTRGADGIRIDPASDTPLVFEHCTLRTGWREVGSEFLARALEGIGIRLNVNAVDAGTVLFANWNDVRADTKCNLARGNYDTAQFLYILTLDLYGNYYYSYHSEQIPTDANGGNGFNLLRLANRDMDAALDTLRSAIAPHDQLQAAYTVQQIYIDQIPELPLLYPNTAIGVSAGLQNFEKNSSTATDMWNIQDWWVTR
jgi:ABC-type transport system substrate-binding protein